MSRRNDYPFYPIDSTAPGYNSSALSNTSGVYPLESTSVREWNGPASRAVSCNSITSGSYYVTFGKSSAIEASTLGYLITAQERDVIHVEAGYKWISFFSTSALTVHYTLGYGQQ